MAESEIVVEFDDGTQGVADYEIQLKFDDGTEGVAVIEPTGAPGPSVLVRSGPAGPAGPPGPPGPKGDPGSGGGSSSRYEHVQASAASTWTVVHGLGTFPNATIFLSTSPEVPVLTDTQYPDSNTAVLTFPSPVTGRAYL